MEPTKPLYCKTAEKCVDRLIDTVGKKIVLAAPLALAKPNHLINELYRRTRENPDLHFTLITAVSLEKPSWSGELEKRLIKPIAERIWEDFPDFEYVLDLRKNAAPENFKLVEFFNKAGGWMNNPHARQNYLGSNYTHAVRDALINECNVIAQLVSKKKVNGKNLISMGSNPDTHLEGGRIFHEKKKRGENLAIIGQVNTNLPFMHGDAVVDPEFYDMIIDNPDYDFKLFGAPKEPVSNADWMIGLHASCLVKDGGTIQVGIGSLGDAIVAGLEMRHCKNSAYRSFLKKTGISDIYADLIRTSGGTGPFDKGLLGSSEMLVDGLIELFEKDVVKRRVYDDTRLQKVINEFGYNERQVEMIFRKLLEKRLLHTRIKPKEFEFLQRFGIFRKDLVFSNGAALSNRTEEQFSLDMSLPENLDRIIRHCLGDTLKNGTALYACFFIGPQAFYRKLNRLEKDRLDLINMCGVDYVNQLYGDEELKRLQRRSGRFINAALMVTLSGAVVADGLENNRIISGPGGQYNFVSMAHALEDARAVTMIRSTRGKGEGCVSNIVWEYGHTTIPRHLRDIVVTEYGIADLRGKKDWEAMTSLICIADSRFQNDLLAKAKRAECIPSDWLIPDRFRNNTPGMIMDQLRPFREKGFFPDFPFGTDLTHEEQVLGKSLKAFKKKSENGKLALIPELFTSSLSRVPGTAGPYLERMGLHRPSGIKERLMQKVVLSALKISGQL
ncbi:MAG: acetyl-CoA hydrolase/transferase C-terminal domain-containing protein [Desulfobacteraceae bacterium]